MSLLENTKALPICFYLPQFHPIAVNDKAWGRGFTEWTNVAKALPLFPDHKQPKLPGFLGFYDLRLPTVLEEQAELASQYGVYGFCFYYYRFGTQRVLDIPIANMLSRPVPEFPFCLCWANESWTRAWDGRTSEVVLQQSYDATTFDGLCADIREVISDERYIRIQGRPVFMIYQLEDLPNAEEWLSNLRSEIRRSCGEDLMIGTVFSHGFRSEMEKIVDFVVQFPPHRVPRFEGRRLIESATIKPFEPHRGDYFESYDVVTNQAIKGIDTLNSLCPGVCPDWDNSPRRVSKAHILIGSSPEKFRSWVETASSAAIRKFEQGKLPAPLLFVNAWNEWGEGAMLEPSQHHGTQYLEALLAGLSVREGAPKSNA